MQVRLADEQLERRFESEKALVQFYGPEKAKVLARRVSELRASRCLADIRALPQTQARELDGEHHGEIALNLNSTGHLLILPDENSSAKRANGDWDWAAVKEITILRITDSLQNFE